MGLTLLEVAAGKYPYPSTGWYDMMHYVQEEEPPFAALPDSFHPSPEFLDFIRQCMRPVGCAEGDAETGWGSNVGVRIMARQCCVRVCVCVSPS